MKKRYVGSSLAVIAVALLCSGKAMSDGSEETLTFDVTNFVAATTVLDLNNDGASDRLVLVRNKAGDAIDMFVTLSDGNGGSSSRGMLPAVLPASPSRGDNFHSISHSIAQAGEQVSPYLTAQTKDIFISISIYWSDQGWQLTELRSSKRRPDEENAVSCYFGYNAGRAQSDRVRQDPEPFEIGPTPHLTPYWWQNALPPQCGS